MRIDKELLMRNHRVDEKGCWIWTSHTHKIYGYGLIFAGQNVLAHRASYAIFIASPIPGMTIDHLCRNRLCINPAHLEEVTRAENSRRKRKLTFSKEIVLTENLTLSPLDDTMVSVH